MITNDRELQAALDWMQYWKSTRHVGQSWLGNEQASQKMIELRRDIDAYRARQAGREPVANPVSAETPDGTP